MSLTRQVMKLHIARVKNILLSIASGADIVNGLFAWKYGAAPSILAMLVSYRGAA